MAVDNNTNSLMRDLVLEVKDQEPLARRKANTVTSVVGTVLTTVAAICTFVLQSGIDLPQETVLVVMIVGMVATDFAVSRTTNGITKSVSDRLELELARRIDLNHNHDDTIAQVAAAQREPSSTGVENVANLRSAAESLAADPT